MVDSIPTAPILTTEKQSDPGGPDVFRHLRTPVNMELSISFHPGGPMPARPVAGAKDSLASALPEDSMKRLRGMEPQVMKWLAASDPNRLLFLSDPLAALQQIDKTLDKTFLKQLQRARQRFTPDDAVDSRIRLAQVRVAVAEKPVTAVPRPARPDPKPPTR